MTLWDFASYGGRGGGALWPWSRNKVTVNGLIWNLVPIMIRMILVNMQNFKLLAFLLLEIWRHKNFLSRMKWVITIRYLPLGIEQNSRKTTFYAWKHLSWHKFITSSEFPWFWNKTKKLYVQVFESPQFKNNWWIDFAKILPKCVWQIKTKSHQVWRC